MKEDGLDRKAIDRYEKLPCSNARLERVMELALEKNGGEAALGPTLPALLPAGRAVQGGGGLHQDADLLRLGDGASDDRLPGLL